MEYNPQVDHMLLVVGSYMHSAGHVDTFICNERDGKTNSLSLKL